MKIGILVDQLLAGGVQLAAIQEVRELNKLGVNAKLLILMRKKYDTDFSYLVKGVPFEYLSDKYPSIFRSTIKLPTFSFLSTLHLVSPLLAPTVVTHSDYDLIVSWGTATCLTAQSIYRRCSIPYIAIIPDPIIYILDKVYKQTRLKFLFPILKPVGEYLEKSFVKDAAETVIISKVHQKYISHHYHKNAKILHLGVKHQRELPHKRGGVILSFGRWQREKNPQFLLKLLQEFKNAKLVVAGSWTNQDELIWFKNLIKKERLNKTVKVIPHFSDKQLSKICKEARMWVYPNFEAFGLAALQAASFGLPIIMPKKSGVTEKFTNGIHGFFLKNVTLDEYKKAVKTLLDDERLAYKMGRKASIVVNKEFSWKSNTRSLMKIIKTVLPEKEKPNIAVIEIGHTYGTTLAGGDKLMEPMAKKLYKDYKFSIIVSQIGSIHWKKTLFKKELIILPRNIFDKGTTPIPVFLNYCLRMWETYLLLNKIDETNIIYSSTNILPDVLPAFIAKQKNKKIKWIARIHHLIPEPSKREGQFLVNLVSYLMQTIALSMMKNSADITIALNNHLQKELSRKGFSKDKLKVLGAGIDFEKINSLNNLTKKNYYDGVFLGRLHPTKGIFDLIPIWKNVVKDIPSVKLAVIGGGQEYMGGNLQKRIEKEKLQDNIQLLGYLPDKDVYKLMKNAKVFLFTDHEAGWGLAAGEAMACKLPVVGYDIGVLGSVFTQGYKKVPLGNYAKFAKIVIMLLKNDRMRKDLSKHALSQARMLDWSNTTQEFKNILTTVI